MKRVNEDRRTRKTKTAIEKAFMELIIKKDLNKITIKDITDKADTNRSTFYTHYEDIYDLLNEVENKIINELVSNTETNLIYIIMNGGHIDITEMLRYIKERETIFSVMLHSNRGMQFFNKLTERIREIMIGTINEEMFPIRDENYRSMMLSFFMNGVAAVLRDWLKSKNDISPEQINAFIEDIMRAAINELK